MKIMLIPANQLRKKYDVYAHFYKMPLKGKLIKMRSQAQIKRKGTMRKKPDCIVIMVNPGSCKPDHDDDQYPDFDLKSGRKPFVRAKTDPTQYQLMRFMDLMNYKHLDILNLSDICEGNFHNFKKLLQQFNENNITAHTIFSQERKTELSTFLKADVPIILGWGTKPEIEDLAELALSRIPPEKIFGIKHRIHPFYLHPAPLLVKKKLEWLNGMKKQLGGDISGINKIL